VDVVNAASIRNDISTRVRVATMPLAWVLLGALLVFALPAAAATITNTAMVTYHDTANAGRFVTLHSNTVETQVMPLPTQATLKFLRYDPASPEATPLPIDGGQCRVAGGSFAPLPEVVDGDGNPLDPGAPGADAAPGYYTGEPVLLSINDPNRNIEPASRDYVDVDLTTSTGDAETLRLQETGVDTGVFAGAIQSVPMPPTATQYDCMLSLAAFAEITARYTDTDFPLDALAVAAAGYAPLRRKTVLRLEQSVSRQIVEIGDFLQYTLTVQNGHDAPAYNTRIRDLLPAGLRYRAGSLRVGDGSAPGPGPVIGPASSGATPAAARGIAAGGLLPAPDPIISTDGLTLSFPVGKLAPGASVSATFVVEVGSGASGDLLNHAIANANGGLVSNDSDSVVRMRNALMTSGFTIIGRVLQGACDAGTGTLKGVANVRLLLDDGTYVPTDENGAYHFEGVRPGTHVVQVDEASMPAGMEIAPCIQNTRFAGRSYSQFVEAQGGSLVRTDFYLRPSAPATGSVGARLKAEAVVGGLHYTVEFDGGEIPVSKLRAMLMLPDGTHYVPGSAILDGVAIADPALTEGIATFDLGDPGVRWRRSLQLQLAADGQCPTGGYAAKAVGLFEAGGKSGQRTPPAATVLPCSPPPAPADSGRVEATATAAAAGQAASPFAEQEKKRAEILDAVAAAGGGGLDWLRGQAPGTDWLFPAGDYNPRAPITRVVVKHLASEKVVLRVNGEPVSLLHYDGTRSSADGAVAVAIWSAVALKEGDNELQADILDKSGAVVSSLSRRIHYSSAPARAELVPEQSVLVADGLRKPVIAVRFLDRSGHPVREGLSGDFMLSPPYIPAQSVQLQQERQLAGLDGNKPTWKIEGDDGIAYIELQPTGVAGSATLGFQFQQDGKQQRAKPQQLQVWLKSAPRDWVVVGFAAGSVGYATLKDNMQALDPAEEGSGIRGDGQVSLYAKGRVLGKWMLTLAYDSDKPTDGPQRQGLLSTIDPNRYYTLYGDGTAQGYDAASADKVYLKLERGQFYALFGDFQTGLDKAELARYQRTLNGAKVEYRGPLLEVNGFAAKTSQNFARDEIPGDGTSGLYRLSHRNMLINSERVRIQARERYHSEQIVDTRELVRHIDYDIDYDNGTLFFREPIASRDFDFNPIFIVVEYETRGGAEKYLNAGGRVGVHMMDDRLQAGLSYIRDEDIDGRSQLLGVDARFKLGEHDELRGEAAASRGDAGVAADTASGSAWLMEWEHRGERLNLLAYARRQAGAFGVGQQNASESGTAKAGVRAQWHLDEHFSLQGEAYRLENLASDATRNAAQVDVAYRAESWGAKAGLQYAHDQGADGKVAESRQLTLAANRFFFGKKLELTAQADLSLGGKNDSVDFPTRLRLGAAYRINDSLRVLAAQEFTDGEDRDTSTTRFGFEAVPWKDAKLTSTLNQSQISEYGPRTFALFGLNQKFLLGERWGLDVAVDSSHAFNESGDAPLVVDPSQPIATGGIRDGGALTEDFFALSGGATYRAELWSWNARVEGRQGDTSDRYGFTTAFLRQARDGVALSASLQAFSQHQADGSVGVLANAQLSWAWRPLGSSWSMLDKLEFRLDSLAGGTGGSMIGNNTLAATGDARSARMVNNFVLNHVSDAWNAEDGQGNVLDLNQRSQLSLYYGSKYVLDSFGGDDYAGYTDILGFEWRYDINPRIDIGIRSSVLHSWSQGTFAWAFGPQVGFSPFTNAWVSVGYNIRGFNDRDFESSHYTAEGAYLVLRMKFDQRSLGLESRATAAAQ
jgi:uncharacterized repeat protein (TIGR01451 family)